MRVDKVHYLSRISGPREELWHRASAVNGGQDTAPTGPPTRSIRYILKGVSCECILLQDEAPVKVYKGIRQICITSSLVQK